MVQQLRTLTALLEDPDSVSGTPMATHDHVTAVLGNPLPSSGFCWHSMQLCAYMQAKHLSDT